MTKSGSWFQDLVLCDGKEVTTACVEDYNKTLLDPIRPITELIMIFSVIVGMIACIAYCKWR